jgi:hypothetical protein
MPRLRSNLRLNTKPCPKCGSNRKDKFGKKTQTVVKRQKLSALRKEARDELTIDKTKNRKFHHVEEQDEDGNWKTVHYEDVLLRKIQEKKK